MLSHSSITGNFKHVVAAKLHYIPLKNLQFSWIIPLFFLSHHKIVPRVFSGSFSFLKAIYNLSGPFWSNFLIQIPSTFQINRIRDYPDFGPTYCIQEAFLLRPFLLCPRKPGYLLGMIDPLKSPWTERLHACKTWPYIHYPLSHRFFK